MNDAALLAMRVEDMTAEQEMRVGELQAAAGAAMVDPNPSEETSEEEYAVPPPAKRRRQDKPTGKTAAGGKKGGPSTRWSMVLLTWSKCPITMEAAYKHVNGLSKHPLKNYVFCRELHEDGSGHLHAFCQWPRSVRQKYYRFDLPNTLPHFPEEILDISEPEREFYSADVVGGIHNAADVINYVMKGGEYIASAGIQDVIDEAEKNRKDRGKSDAYYQDILTAYEEGGTSGVKEHMWNNREEYGQAICEKTDTWLKSLSHKKFYGTEEQKDYTWNLNEDHQRGKPVLRRQRRVVPYMPFPNVKLKSD